MTVSSNMFRISCSVILLSLTITFAAQPQCDIDCASQFKDCEESTFQCRIKRETCVVECREETTRTNQIWKDWSDSRLKIWKEHEHPNLWILVRHGINRGIGKYDNWDYGLRIDDFFRDPRGIRDSTKRVLEENLNTPQYWLAVALAGGSFERAQGQHGVPILDVGTGIYYLAKGLSHLDVTMAARPSSNCLVDDGPDREAIHDLLLALYVAADGSPNGAAPLIDRTLGDLQHVRARVKDWMRTNRTFYPEDIDNEFKLAYLFNTLVSDNRRALGMQSIQDKELAEFALGILANVLGGPYRRAYVALVNRNELAGLHGMYPGQYGRYQVFPVLYYKHYVLTAPTGSLRRTSRRCLLSNDPYVFSGHEGSHDLYGDWDEWELVGPNPQFDTKSP